MSGRGALQLAAIAITGLAVAAIIRAASKAADYFDCEIADGDWPHVPRVNGRPAMNGGGGDPSGPNDRPFETHNVTFRTRHLEGLSR